MLSWEATAAGWTERIAENENTIASRTRVLAVMEECHNQFLRSPCSPIELDKAVHLMAQYRHAHAEMVKDLTDLNAYIAVQLKKALEHCAIAALVVQEVPDACQDMDAPEAM